MGIDNVLVLLDWGRILPFLRIAAWLEAHGQPGKSRGDEYVE